jgi:flagellar protein FliO/FliZ
MYLIGVGENVEMLQELTDEQVKKDLLHTNETKDSPAGAFVLSLFQSKSTAERPSASKQNN